MAITTKKLIAEEYIVSSSVTLMTQSFSSGSTNFGDSIDDTHRMTGSLFTSGSNLSIGSSVTNSTLNLFSPDNTQIQFQDDATGTSASDGVRVGWNGTVGQFWVFESAGFRLATSNTERLTIDSSGNVGIGNTSPGSLLTVGDNVGNIMIDEGGAVAEVKSNGGIYIGLDQDNNSTTSDFRIFNNGNSNNVLLEVKEAGNVGIGTATPQYKFEVYLTDNQITSVAAAQMSVGSFAGFHFGYREPNAFYRHSQIRFQRTDRFANNAMGRVMIINKTGTDSSNPNQSDSHITIDELGFVGIGRLVGGDYNNGKQIEALLHVSASSAVGTATASLHVEGSGSLVVSVDGTQGRLFSISDELSGSLFSANTISGLPVIEAFSDNRVTLGPYSNPVTVTSTGNVGIGTATPVGLLTLYDPASGDNKLRFQNSTTGVTTGDGSRIGLNGAELFINNIESSLIKIYTGTTTTQGITIDNTGRIGIGTATPGNYHADADNLVLYGSGNSGMTIASGTSNTGNIWFADGTGGVGEYQSRIQFNHDGNTLMFAIGDTEIMRFLSSGNVGIGTTSPDNQLDVVTSTGDVIAAVRSTSNTSGHDAVFLANVAGTSAGDPMMRFNIDNVGAWTIGADNTDSDKFKISGLSSVLGTNDRLVIDTSGNVGIGHSSPEVKLQVMGNTTISGSDASALDLFVRNTHGTGLARMIAQSNNTSMNAQLVADDANDYAYVGSSTGGSKFIYFKSGTDAYFDGGNFGIGASSPVVKLDVYGSVNLRSEYNLTWGGTAGANIPLIYGKTGDGGHLAFHSQGTDGESLRLDASNNAIFAGNVSGSAASTGSFGKLSIGTANPVYAHLNVAGDISLGTHTANLNRRIGLQRSDGAGWTNTPNINFSSNGGSDGSIKFSVIDSGVAGYADAMVIYYTGNVGIGSTTPTAKLDVAGTTKQQSYTAYYHSDHSTLAGYVGSANALSSEATNDIMIRAVNDFHIGTNNSGTVRFTVLSGGNVGIGTTAPDTPLDVHGAVTVDGNGGQAQFKMRADAGDGQAIYFTNAASGYEGAIVYDNTGTTDEKMQFNVNQGTRMTILADGKVGIGGATTPTSTLHVFGTEIRMAGDTPAMVLQDTSAFSAGTGPSVFFQGLQSGESLQTFAAIQGQSVGSGTGALAFQTRQSGTTGTKMYLDEDGKLGIGTTDPGAQLHVVGNSFFQGSKVSGSSHSTGSFGMVHAGVPSAGLSLGSTSNGHALIQSRTIGDYIQYNANGGHFFTTNGANYNFINSDNNFYNGSSIIQTSANGVISGSSTSTGSFGRVHASNKLAVGTTTVPSGVTAQIQASDDTKLRVGTANATFYAELKASVSNDTPMQIIGRGGDVMFKQRTSATEIEFLTDNTSRMYLDSTGLGIGTTSPAFPLDVRKSTSDPVAFFGFSQVNAENKHGLIVIQSGTIPQSGGDLSGEAGIIFRHSGGTGGSNFDGNAGSIKSLKMDTYAASGQAHNRLAFSTTFNNTDSEKMTILDSGNVGIGETSPGTLLHIKKNDTAGPTITLENSEYEAYINAWGSSGGGSGRFNRVEINAGSSKDFAVGAATLRFQIGGVGDTNEKMRLHSNGYLGIGETSPSAPLHVSGDGGSGDPLATMLLESTTNHGGLVVNAPASKQTHLRFQNNGTLKWQMRSPFHDGTNPDSLRFYSFTLGTDVMTFKNDGTVGIGTANPIRALDVVVSSGDNTIRMATADQAVDVINLRNADGRVGLGGDVITVKNSDVGIGTNNPLYKLHIEGTDADMLLYDTNTAGLLIIKGAGNGFINAGISLQTTNGSHDRGMGIFMHDAGVDSEWFAGIPYATGGSYMIGYRSSIASHSNDTAQTTYALMTIKNDGNVGIGLTDPSRKIHINQTVTTQGGIYVYSNAVHTGAGTNALISVYSDNASANGDTLYVRNDGTGNLLTLNNDGTDRLVVKDGGNVGIGITNPTGSLHVMAAQPEVIIQNSTQDGSSTILRLTEAPIDGKAGGFMQYDGSANKFHIGTHMSGTDTKKITVLRDSTKIGIGTETPDATLDVEGSTILNSAQTDSDFILYNDAITAIDLDGTAQGASSNQHSGRIGIMTARNTNNAVVNIGGSANSYFGGGVVWGTAITHNVTAHSNNSAGLYVQTTMTGGNSQTNPVLANALFDATTWTEGVSNTINLAANVYISAAPTVTNHSGESHALHVASGTSFFGGNISGSQHTTASFGMLRVMDIKNQTYGNTSPSEMISTLNVYADKNAGPDQVVGHFLNDEANVNDGDSILRLEYSDDQTIDGNQDFITFYNQTQEVGSINSQVAYSTFTGMHVSQRPSGSDFSNWKPGMVVKSTGKIIHTSSISNAWPEVELTSTQKDKACVGVFSYTSSIKTVKGLDSTLPRIYYNAIGEGLVRVTDTGGNIEVGDYICSSTRSGHGEKQDDDLLHNYTVAKATQPYNFASASNDSELGYKSVLIGCTYHCG